MFFGALKDNNDNLSYIGADKIIWNGNSATADIEVEFSKDSGADLLQMLLWKENLSPICEPYTLKK